MSRISILKRSIRTASAGLVLAGSFLSGVHRGLQRPNFHAMQSWMSQYSGLPIAKADLP
jgi:hypothetical protein